MPESPRPPRWSAEKIWCERNSCRFEEPSGERVKPGCPYFGRCGGCDYQHASYPYQLTQKEMILREVLQRIGHITAPDQMDVIAGEPWGYRNRSQFHIDRGQLGYLRKARTNSVQSIIAPSRRPRSTRASRCCWA